MRILLTGSPGIGKTTAIRRILRNLQGIKCSGFYTDEKRERGQRRGFMIRTLDGEEGTLASVGGETGPRVGRYMVHIEELERVVLPRINPEESPAELYVIDEIGKMELMSKKFRESIITLLAQPSNILATVAIKGKGFLDQVKGRNDVDLIEVTKENRDSLPETTAHRIVTALKGDQNAISIKT
jgi:nucleoside-triphosphatase